VHEIGEREGPSVSTHFAYVPDSDRIGERLVVLWSEKSEGQARSEVYRDALNRATGGGSGRANSQGRRDGLEGKAEPG